MDRDNAADQILLTNTSAHAEYLQQSLEQAAKGFGLYINSDKTDFMCFKQNGAISVLNDKPLKLIDHFMYLGSNVSSTERDVNTCIEKVCPATNR